MPHLVQIAYITKYQTKQTLKEAKTIATGIKDVLSEVILKNADWLNKTTKNYILEKITNTTFVIGVPDEFFPAQQNVSSIVGDDDNFLLMTLRAKKYSYNQQYLRLIQKENHMFNELIESVLTVYPYYSFKYNLIGK